MTFEAVLSERRSRFVEVLNILNYLESLYSNSETVQLPRVTTPDNIEKSLKGLFLVALYGAFEKSINIAVEKTISEILLRAPSHNRCNPEIFTIFLYSDIQSLRAASKINVFDKSLDIFSSINKTDQIRSSNTNPLAELLQNVDGATLVKVLRYFGIRSYRMPISSAGRLGNLRERRNAIAHGRETAATVGERFNYNELRQMYSVADSESGRFFTHLDLYCKERMYEATVIAGAI
jgi:hypothetical protein